MLSKVYERPHIDRHSILNEKIPGYRKGHLTTTLLLRFRDDIIQAMKRDEIMPVFPDLSKAFDTVDHTRISWKNAQMGYMREKRQFARVNDQTSELIDVQFRVEQGSMLELALSTLLRKWS